MKFEKGAGINMDDGVDVKSLWPPPDSDWDHVDDLNDVAQVCLLRFGYFTALFTGDAGANVDERLEGIGHIDLLKVAHHGSKTGMSQSFLQKITPYASVISVGAKNRYGHPAPSTLRQLAEIGSDIWRTDMNGRLEIRVNAAGFSVHPDKIQYNTAL
jgi:competence protein ComEC